MTQPHIDDRYVQELELARGLAQDRHEETGKPIHIYVNTDPTQVPNLFLLSVRDNEPGEFMLVETWEKEVTTFMRLSLKKTQAPPPKVKAAKPSKIVKSVKTEQPKKAIAKVTTRITTEPKRPLQETPVTVEPIQTTDAELRTSKRPRRSSRTGS